MTGLYTGLFITLCTIKYHYYLYKDFDLAIFAQILDQLLQGSLFTSVRGMHWLGDHSSLALFLILPIYAVFRHPMTLLVLQTAVLAIGALPVYWIARRELKGEVLPLALVAAYLLYPALGYANLYEFHPETLATAPLLFTFHYLRQGQSARALVFAALALLCREDVALVILMMVVHHVLTVRPRAWRLAAGLVTLSALSLLLTFAVLVPAYNRGEANYAGLFAEWGGSIGEALLNMAAHPLEVLSRFYSTPGNPADGILKQQWYVHMLLPVLFTPLSSPAALLIALPIVAEHMLSSRYTGHTIVFHYAALVIPGFMIAAILGTRNLQRVGERLMRGRPSSRAVAPSLAGLLLMAAIAGNVMFGPVIGRGILQDVKSKELVLPTPTERTVAPYIRQALDRVPEYGGVIAGFEGLAHLTDRGSLHSMHHVLRGRYTASELPYPMPDDVVAIVADMRPMIPYLRLHTGTRMARLIERNRLKPVVGINDFVLFMRDAPDTMDLVREGSFDVPVPTLVTFDRQLAFVGCDSVFVVARPGEVVTCVAYWRRTAPVDRSFYMQMGFFDRDGESRHMHTRPLGYGVYPAHDWPEGVTVRETMHIIVPEDLEPGLYDLSFMMKWISNEGLPGVADAETPIAGMPTVIPIGWIRVVERVAS